MNVVALSPSRTSDYKTCPQLFKYRAIDHLPEPEDPASARGTLVHLILQQLLGNDLQARSFEDIEKILEVSWETLRAEAAEAGMVFSESEEAAWLEEVRTLLRNYLSIEDPAGVTAHELEWWVEHDTGDLLLRGVIDRVEVDSDGRWTISDYKTGRSPSDTYALGAFFGLKFYALVCWRAFGQLPAKLRLVHLREPEVLTLVPTEQMLLGLERQLNAIAAAIRKAIEKDDFRPRPSYACAWCPHQAICPAFAETDPLANATKALAPLT